MNDSFKDLLQTVDVAVAIAIAASVLRPDTQVNGRQAVGATAPSLSPSPSPAESSPRAAPKFQLPSIYLSSIHPCIHTKPFSPCQAAAKSALICGSAGEKFRVSLCVSVCLLVNLSFSFSFNFFSHPLFPPLATTATTTTHSSSCASVSCVCGLPLCEITKKALSASQSRSLPSLHLLTV